MESKAHNTVTEDSTTRCSCWQHVWKHSNGQQQQLLWKETVCLIHCFCAALDFPALSRDLEEFNFKFWRGTVDSAAVRHNSERDTAHKVPAKHWNCTKHIETLFRKSDMWLKTQGSHSRLQQKYCWHPLSVTYIRAATYQAAYSSFQWGWNLCKCVLCHTMPVLHTCVNPQTDTHIYTLILNLFLSCKI